MFANARSAQFKLPLPLSNIASNFNGALSIQLNISSTPSVPLSIAAASFISRKLAPDFSHVLLSANPKRSIICRARPSVRLVIRYIPKNPLTCRIKSFLFSRPKNESP
jgi:hypothetical protein